MLLLLLLQAGALEKRMKNVEVDNYQLHVDDVSVSDSSDSDSDSTADKS